MKPLNIFLISLIIVLSLGLIAVNFKGFALSKSIPEIMAKNFPKYPKLKENVNYPVLSAQSVIAVDLDSRVNLYEKDPDKGLLPASTTKIVTALVALDYYPQDLVLEVINPKVEGQKMGLFKGEKMTVINLLNGLLVYSANDAAEVLAQNYPGGREAFIAAMNLKAKELNLNNSHFSNPVGLDGDTLTTTARDMERVAEVAMTNPTFAQIVGTKEIIVKSLDGRVAHKLENINKLLGVVPGVMGVKTGWTENARENLVTYIERDGHKVMIVIFGSQDRFGETTELINWIFSSYDWNEVKFPWE